MGTASMQQAGSLGEPGVFRVSGQQRTRPIPVVPAAVKHFSRPGSPSEDQHNITGDPRTPAGDPGPSTALRPAPNCPRQSQPGDDASQTANSVMVPAPRNQRPDTPRGPYRRDLRVHRVQCRQGILTSRKPRDPPSRTSPATQTATRHAPDRRPRQNDPIWTAPLAQHRAAICRAYRRLLAADHGPSRSHGA
jgi:hypothetical protein